MESSEIQVLPSWYRDIFECEKDLKTRNAEFKDIRDPIDVKTCCNFEKQGDYNIVAIESDNFYFVSKCRPVFAVIYWCTYESRREPWAELSLITPREPGYGSSMHMISKNKLSIMIKNDQFLKIRDATELELNRLYKNRDRLKAEYDSDGWQRFIDSQSSDKPV